MRGLLRRARARRPLPGMTVVDGIEMDGILYHGCPVHQVNSLGILLHTMKQVNRLIRRVKVLRAFAKAATTLSALLAIAGVVAFLLLPTDPLRPRSYISENALLPAQIHTHFSYNDYQLIYDLDTSAQVLPTTDAMRWVYGHLNAMGYETHRLPYPCRANTTLPDCQAVYAILRAPRADGSEALVLSTSWDNERSGSRNIYGSLLTLALAKFWRRFSYWAKDVVFVFAPDVYGVEQWVQAYHSSASSVMPSPTPMAHAGSVQAAVHLDFSEFHVKGIGIEYDGFHGQQPNMDLVSTFYRVAQSSHVPISFHGEGELAIGDDHDYSITMRRILYALKRQAQQQPRGPHGVFRKFGVDAVTLHGVTDAEGYGMNSINTIAIIIESSFRSLNNLLERFHHSYLFYIPSSSHHFSSMMFFLPSVCLVNASMLIKAIRLWLISESPEASAASNSSATDAPSDFTLNERAIGVPLVTLAIACATGLALTYLSQLDLGWPVLVAAIGIALMLPPMSQRAAQLLICFGLIVSSAVVSSLAIINFGQGAAATALLAPAWILVFGSDMRRLRAMRWVAVLLLHPVIAYRIMAFAADMVAVPELVLAKEVVGELIGVAGSGVVWGICGSLSIVWARLLTYRV
ncbi:Gaa1-like protein [Catenaria anguillulae PL171]|uniref:Gaa1-like protein n=1 Tax=Catenaria anguillulae PL171 TaxID=765915 RepID=A0A1Y2H6V6_9FUNG|nr:Gaa1-like protein [Catenaria anguillulae PL171]